jgi:hypothetical protein
MIEKRQFDLPQAQPVGKAPAGDLGPSELYAFHGAEEEFAHHAGATETCPPAGAAPGKPSAGHAEQQHAQRRTCDQTDGGDGSVPGLTIEEAGSGFNALKW